MDTPPPPKKKRKHRLPTFLREAEAQSLLATAQAHVAKSTSQSKLRAAYMDLIIVLTGVNTGLRVAELCALKIEELDLEQRTLIVMHGKGDKQRMVPIGPKLFHSLVAWIGDRKLGFVFTSPRGGKLAVRTVQTRMAALGKKAGLARKLHPHIFRHSFATRLLDRGANIREVQELLGHASVATTENYTHVAIDRLKKATDRL